MEFEFRSTGVWGTVLSFQWVQMVDIFIIEDKEDFIGYFRPEKKKKKRALGEKFRVFIRGSFI